MTSRSKISWLNLTLKVKAACKYKGKYWVQWWASGIKRSEMLTLMQKNLINIDKKKQMDKGN